MIKRIGFPTQSVSDERRPAAAREIIAAEMEKPLPDLLQDIHEASLATSDPDSRGLACTIASFATLLWRFSKKADRMQCVLIWLTAIIGVLTLALVALTGVLVYKVFFP